MKYLFSITFFSLCLFTATAQHQLKGTVKNLADSLPVPYATVALLRPDSTVITGEITGDDGKFIIQNIASGDYLLQVSFIGYDKYYRRVSIPAQNDLGEIFLSERAGKLQEVVITGSRPLVSIKADRYIVNVSGNIQSAGRDALDILRNTPGVLVDHNGNVSVLGNSVQIWIDGRPSRMSGEQLKAFLNSMQGGEIDRIEVITNPSSRFDAEGAGGIIDIRTKRGLQYGLNGTLTAGYRQGEMDSENAGVSLNLRREKFNTFGNYSINRNKFMQNFGQIYVMETSAGKVTFDQNSNIKSTDAGLRNTLRAGMDFFLNPKNTLGFIVNAYHSGCDKMTIKGINNIIPALNGVSFSESDNIQSRSDKGIQVNANYQSTFNKPGQQLNVDLDYAIFSSDPFQQNKNIYYDLNNAMIGVPEQFRNSNPQNINVYSAKIDYMQPVWKNARLETGVKVSNSQTDNDLKYDVFSGNSWQIDLARTNRFEYSERIDAAYLNLSQQLGKLSLQAGLRAENTSWKSEQKTTGEKNDITYFNVFPTFFANWQASSKHILGLSYSYRLSRPGYYLLNPFEITVDAYSFIRGNPNLMPAYTHNIQLSHTFAQSLMTRISYSSTNGLFMQSPIEDAATNRYGMTFINFGKSQNINVMMNYRKQIVKIWTANLTLQGIYTTNTSNEVSGEFVNKGTSLVAQLNNNINITPTLSAEMTGLYVSGIRQAYYVFQSMGNFSIGLRQTLMKNKLTLSLTVNDIFLTLNQKGYARYDNVNYSLSVKNDSRYANLTLRYNFGSSTVKAARNKTTGIEDEASRAKQSN